ncbi:MAG: BON domain-containing protein [Bacteroidota bacterium]
MSASTRPLGNALPSSLRSLLERHQQRRAKTTVDKSSARRLREGVRRAGLSASGLSVYVHDGAISLYGTVPDEATREALLGVASAQPGVRRIVDHLRVEVSPPIIEAV